MSGQTTEVYEMEIEGEANVDCPHCGKNFDTPVTIDVEPVVRE